MRGRKKDSRSSQRVHRRGILAGLLVASGQVAMADPPVAIAPLPLTILSGEEGQCLQVNPFCQSMPPVLGPATASVVGGPVQLVPLAPLVPLDAGSLVVQSSGQQFEASANAIEQGAVHFRIEESPQRIGGGVRSNPLALGVPRPTEDAHGVKPPVLAAGRSHGPGGAISFSLTDENGAVEQTNQHAPPEDTAGVVRESSPTRLFEAAPQPRARVPWRGSGVSDAAAEDPAPTLARPSQAGRTLLVPIEDQQDSQVMSAVGRMRLPERKSKLDEEPRLVNGARPKVEVGRPPLVIQRERSLRLPLEVPQPDEVVEATLPDQTIAAVSEEQLVPIPELSVKANLRFRPTEVRALKVQDAIQRVEIQNTAVCAAVKTASNQVQLIATGVGTTKLTLWTVDSAGDEQGELYEIQVAEAQATQAEGAESIAATLTQSVGNAFPNSRILVRYHGGRLVVTGTCENEESARRVLRMIRSACPMPVDDKVVVR